MFTREIDVLLTTTMKPILFFIVFTTAISTARARLGETREECDVRYGSLVSVKDDFRPDFPQYCYAKNDVEIRVRFWQGKVGQIIISSDHGMADNTISEILQGNAEGSSWKIDNIQTRKIQDPKTYSVACFYRRADGNATAEYHKMQAIDSDTIVIETSKFNDAFNAKASGF